MSARVTSVVWWPACRRPARSASPAALTMRSMVRATVMPCSPSMSDSWLSDSGFLPSSAATNCLISARTAVLAPIFVLGFSKDVIDAYIVVVGFQAVFNHANVRLPDAFARAPLKWLIVTPDFHHWHHSSEREAIDRNYAAHFAFIDADTMRAAPLTILRGSRNE